MVFSSVVVVSVASWSASACQWLACNPEHLSSEHVLNLLCCLPFREIRRLVVCVWSFFCVWRPDFYLDSSSDDDYSNSDGDSDYVSYHNDSHSD